MVLVPFSSGVGVDLGSFWRHFRPWGVPGVPLGSLEWLDGVLGGPVGVPWASLGILWGSMGHPWGPMGNPWGVLVRTMGVPGASTVRSWEPPGAPLGAPGSSRSAPAERE